jgi:hypothetical protein
VTQEYPTEAKKHPGASLRHIHRACALHVGDYVNGAVLVTRYPRVSINKKPSNQIISWFDCLVFMLGYFFFYIFGL